MKCLQSPIAIVVSPGEFASHAECKWDGGYTPTLGVVIAGADSVDQFCDILDKFVMYSPELKEKITKSMIEFFAHRGMKVVEDGNVIPQ